MTVSGQRGSAAGPLTDTAFTTATNAVKTAEAEVKKLDPIATKATDEKNAAERALKAAERGLSIFEFAPLATAADREYWQPLLRWLASPRSLPAAPASSGSRPKTARRAKTRN